MREYTHKKGMDPLVAGAFTIAGMALGTAATLYFSKKENREKVNEKFSLLKEKAKHTYDNMVHKAENKAQEVDSKAQSLRA